MLWNNCQWACHPFNGHIMGLSSGPHWILNQFRDSNITVCPSSVNTTVWYPQPGPVLAIPNPTHLLYSIFSYSMSRSCCLVLSCHLLNLNSASLVNKCSDKNIYSRTDDSMPIASRFLHQNILPVFPPPLQAILSKSTENKLTESAK